MANLSNINGKFVVDTAGNIGVGTLVPRSDANTTNISIQSSGTARLFVNNTGANGKEYAIYSSANGDFGIFDYDAVSARLVINSAGNATFAGSVTAGGADDATALFLKRSGGANVMAINTSANGSWTMFDYAAGTYTSGITQKSGNVGIGTGTPTANYPLTLRSKVGDYTKILDWGTDVGGSWGTMQISISAPYATELRSGAWNFAQGNVGIGTDSPGNKLTIASGTGGGSAPDSRTLLHIDKDGEAYISINSPAESFNGIRLSVAGSPKAFMELYDNTAQGKKLNIGTTDARDLVFDTGNQPKMTILSGGNVGIGQTGPSFKLDVNGTGYFADLLRVDEPVYSYTNSGTKHYTHLATGSLYGSGASAAIITTNIPGHNISGNGNMFSFKIVGYAYTMGIIDMTVGMYAGENNFYSVYWSGTCQDNWIGNVYVFTNSAGATCIQLGEVTDVLNCEIAVTDFVQGFGNVDANYSKGWSIAAVTTLPTQNQKTTLNYKTILPDVYEDVTFHNKVGIGTTLPTMELHIAASKAGNAGVTVQNTNSSYSSQIRFLNSVGTEKSALTFVPSDTSLRFYHNGSDRMTIASGGEVLFGTQGTPNGTSIYGSGFVTETNGRRVLYMAGSNTAQVSVQRFYNPNGQVGEIKTQSSSTLFVTSSDYRLKENVVELTGALDRVSQLKPSRFNFIADADTTVDGFLAHEVQEIVPEAITGEKDAVDEEGNPDYQGIDQSKLVPLLVGAIKELKADNDSLKARIETLENN